MKPSLPQDFTQLLERHQSGEKNLREPILTAIYAELRRLAGHYMAAERPGHTLQPTAIVHETWMRFASQEAVAKNKAHFMALAAGVMKEVLIDHARKKLSAKRGGNDGVISFDDSMGIADSGPAELLELCDTIEKLRALDKRHAELVELRVFGGLSFEEAAQELGVSLATVKRDWLLARAWLIRELKPT
jgi:RNA polymerase sigma-70 factor (ECF subfamily)